MSQKWVGVPPVTSTGPHGGYSLPTDYSHRDDLVFMQPLVGRLAAQLIAKVWRVCLALYHAHLAAQQIYELRQLFNSRVLEELTYAGFLSPAHSVFAVVHGDAEFE